MYAALCDIANLDNLNVCPPSLMWFITAETPESFADLVIRLRANLLHCYMYEMSTLTAIAGKHN